MNKTKRGSGKRRPAPKSKRRRVAKAAAAPKDKFAKIGEALKGASAKELAALAHALLKGGRTALRGVKLTAFEAGFLAGEIRCILRKKGPGWVLMDRDHMMFFVPQ